MSFDLRIIEGDIVINRRGDVDNVVNSDKLAQDVLKVLNTTLGSDPFNPNYGSLLTAASIGQMSNIDIVTVQIQNIIEQSLQSLIQMQTLQKTYQYVSDAETIVDFDSPIVEQSATDPRQYNITVSAVSRDMTPITMSFMVVV
jgi:phage baseplate assembly protein W